MKQNKSKNLLIIIGALAYVVYFGIIKGLELQLPMYIKVGAAGICAPAPKELPNC